MKAWELLKHLEEGGRIELLNDSPPARLGLDDLSGWDYDPIRNPEYYILVEDKPYTDKDVDDFLEENSELMDKLDD